MKKNKIFATFGFFLLSFTLLLTLIDFFCFNRNFYSKEYAANNTTLTTGLTEDGLNEATDVLLSYLKDDRDTLDLQLEVNGNISEVFGEREKAHMIDVKQLYLNALLVRNVTGIIGVVFFLIGWFLTKENKVRTLRQGFQYGVLILFGIVSAVLIYALMDFNTFWINFHHVFFDNDLWLLNPNTDILINMVPESFFYHLVLRIVIWFLGIIALVEGIFVLLQKRKKIV